MRFKVFYEDTEQKIKINVLTDTSQDKILPQNTDQHVYYPIPNIMIKEVDKTIQAIIEDEDTLCLKQYDDDIDAMIKRRAKKIKDLRQKYNVKIMEYCEEYKMNNPEWFI